MENKIIIEDFKSLKKKKISSGFNGTCYLTDDLQIFKRIENPNEDKLLRLSKLNSSCFVFPKQLVYNSHGKLVGYIMEYVDGNTIKNIPEWFSLGEYTSELERIENEIAVLTNYKLHIIDAGVNNIMYNSNNKLKVIDTDFYEIPSDVKGLYSANLSNINYSLLLPIIDISSVDLHNQILDGYRKKTLNGKMKASDFLFELGWEIYSRGDYPEATVQGFSYQLKKI